MNPLTTPRPVSGDTRFHPRRPGRIPKEDKGFIDTGQRMSSLRPSTAYLMLCLAEPTVGDVVVDW